MFEAAPVPVAAAEPAIAPESAEIISYDVEGADPVFVKTNGGVATILQGDAVYTDAEGTMPYPDGAFKVAGVDFTFTVAGGVVTEIVDAEGNGAGTPKEASVSPVEDEMGAFKSEFEAFKNDFTSHKLAFTQIATDFAAAKETITKQDEAIKGLLSVVEQLSKVPTANPAEPQKNIFTKQKASDKEDRLKAVQEAFAKTFSK